MGGFLQTTLKKCGVSEETLDKLVPPGIERIMEAIKSGEEKYAIFLLS